MPKVIEVIYENGVFKPLEKVDIRDRAKLKIKIESGKKDVLRSYKGFIKLKKNIKLKDILELEDELWLH